ncbi:hypothetical protein GUJ93_ZPchr0003g18374 [Zizania palustris]|uniref:Uncharacterized protein n=1 Tax=Zizania palustris TaxID=103762 RepID=A0A8J5VX75_ZIZPA|nr:hypothetical protein GUJ93_ZPchr0003g18374 [Zizania palustris]
MLPPATETGQQPPLSLTDSLTPGHRLSHPCSTPATISYPGPSRHHHPRSAAASPSPDSSPVSRSSNRCPTRPAHSVPPPMSPHPWPPLARTTLHPQLFFGMEICDAM